MATLWRSAWIVALVAVSLGLVGCRKTPVDLPIAWESNVDATIAKARGENKLVLVYFGASWDSAAKELEHNTFMDPEVRFLLRRDFVSVHVDATDDEDRELQNLQRRFKVLGDPTVVILGRDGTTEIARFNEYVRPEVFATILQRATRPDAVREARFEAAARERAEEQRREEEQQRWEAMRRKGNLAPTPVIVLDLADAAP